jgi:hypothetical protein
MQTGFLLAAAALAASLCLDGCGRKQGDDTPLPNIPATVPATALPPVAAALPASGTPIARTLAKDVATESAITAGGAETSPSKATGPGNGSTATGGMTQ